MVELTIIPTETLDNRLDHSSTERLENPDAAANSPPPEPHRRDRDSRERRDDRDFDRAPHNRFVDRSRDRDFKRRLSPDSPGSPPYRDRRSFSPSRRYSPPYQPFKRSRREEGGFDGRRGSPRGGGGFDHGGDRRFGYDYPGERDMGGRHGYAKDRSHGRFWSGGFPGGPPDWESERGGYGDHSNAGNIQREGMMTYKQFIQELEDDILPTEAEHRYNEYKSAYFESHKDEEWLKDKYHPTNLLLVIDRRNEVARKVAKDFLLDLHSENLDLGPNITVGKSGQTSEPNSEDEADVGGKRRRYGQGFINISAAPKAHPVSSAPKRVLIDIELAQALVTKLDSEKGIKDNILSRDDAGKMNKERSHSGSIGPVILIRGLTSVKGLEGVELLDTLVTYLWRIHGVDYYGLLEAAEPKGNRHVRTEGKSSALSVSAAEWEKKLDSQWQERLRTKDPLEVMTAKEKVDAAAVEALDSFVRKSRDEKYGWKYGCGAKGCTKLFHASEYVHRHLKLKHPELVVDAVSKVQEDIYFQNYMNDPNAPVGQPVMQQFVPKEKMQRRRPGLEGRLRDDRGPRRDRDRNGSERFERSDNPDCDNDGPDKGNPDEPIFDSYEGQGMRAGPLGPFIVAPPETARRMLRERQGAPSFEGQGRATPQIIPRQDPRPLRSYHDLDAPDDEVTVIDYRTSRR